MTRVVLADEARESLGEIYAYTQKRWGEDQARQYLERVHDACGRVARKPSLGRLIRKIGDREMRRISVGSHVVVYVPRARDILIIAVLHGAMDLPARMRTLATRMRARKLL